jgi:hypothetical protein
MDNSHTLPTTTRDGLNQYTKLNFLGFLEQILFVLIFTMITWHNWYFCIGHDRF